MHILIVPSAYPTIENPLSSIFYKEQSVAIREVGNKVGVIFSETRNLTKLNINNIKKNHFQTSVGKEDGLLTYRKHGWNIFTMRGSIGVQFWIYQVEKLFEEYIVKEGKPDIIHAHCALFGGVAAIRIKEKYNIPVVITEHSSSILNGFVRSHEKDIVMEAYNKADALISVGRSLGAAMSNYTDKRIKIIPNIVDIKKFNLNSKKNKKEFKFISICNLKENKGVKELIDAFYKCFKDKLEVKLEIIGEGVEREALLNQIVDLNLSNQVELVGAIGRDKIRKYLDNADAFVLPSKYETFGIAYIEALACGLPIIATKCGGPEDFFVEDLGYMIEVDNEAQLVKAMKDMVLNLNNFNPQKISEYISSKFSKEIIVNDIQKVYNEISGKSK